MSAYDVVSALGISLPEVALPVAAYVPFVKSGRLLFLSGHIPKQRGTPWVGQLGVDMTTAEGALAARSVAIDLIATLHAATGDLDSITRIVKLMVLVNSSSTFTEQHHVANGASELIQQVFGAQGAHVRSAFGVAQIPLGCCLEIELIAEVR